MGFFTPLLAVFQIHRRHRHQEVVEMLGACFSGLLGTDHGTSYEAEALDTVEQQKCLSHLLKNLSAVEETRTGRARAFTRELKAPLREAVKLWRDHREQASTPEQYRERGRLVRQKPDRQPRDRQLRDPDNQRLLPDGIGLQHDNGRVPLFLEHQEIEPTNNRAERGLRGAATARKVSHCSKNERGARTCEVMKSITAPWQGLQNHRGALRPSRQLLPGQRLRRQTRRRTPAPARAPPGGLSLSHLRRPL